MGFGTLFIGYFLLLNFAFSGFTDAISAVLMLYALYKLSGINKGFMRAMYASLAFLCFSVGELIAEALDIFLGVGDITTLTSLMALARYLLVGLLTVLILRGIEEVGTEVKLHVLSDKAKRMSILTIVIYSVDALLEVIGLLPFNSGVFVYFAVIMIVLTLTVIIMNLTVIYSAYMRICMPNEKEPREKESRFAFVNAFRRHEEEKQREYTEYRLEKAKKKREKEAAKKKCQKK